MKIALKEALKAYKQDEVPVGAVIIKDGIVISKAYNRREKLKSVTAHAEIMAVEKACKKLDDWRLTDCVMYVTLQPCLMCEMVLKEARIEKVVYGTENISRAGGFDTKSNLKMDCEPDEECEQLLKMFFKSKRK